MVAVFTRAMLATLLERWNSACIKSDAGGVITLHALSIAPGAVYLHAQETMDGEIA